MLNDIAEDASSDGSDQRMPMVDDGSGHCADDRAARLTVVFVMTRVMRCCVMAAVIRRGEGTTGWQHQREAEDGG